MDCCERTATVPPVATTTTTTTTTPESKLNCKEKKTQIKKQPDRQETTAKKD